MDRPANPPSKIFIIPALQSAFHLLTCHIHKNPASSSHLHSQLSRLHQALLQFADKIPSFTHQQSTHLLAQLRDAAYAADDLVDEIEYEALQQEAEGFARDQPNEPRGGNQTLLDPLNNKSSLDTVEAQDTSFKDAIEVKIAEIVEKLDFLGAQLENALDPCEIREALQQEATNNVGNHEVSATQEEKKNKIYGRNRKKRGFIMAISKMCRCFDGKGEKNKASFGDGDFEEIDGAPNDNVIKGNIYGRHVERDQLVKMLLGPSEERVSVIPIIGKGGVGKTTLAHSIYTDERVAKHFHTREWICASDTFDMMRIAGELEESLYLQGPLDQLQLLDLYEKNMVPELKGKRFLLVLDDARCVDWALRFGAIDNDVEGSKILLTAREEQAVDERSRRNKICLEGMSGEDFWAFFKKYSFGDDDPKKHPELVSIGKQIARKLDGSPLAAKMIGRVLRDKLNRGHWVSILESDMWEGSKDGGDVMPCLRLSYKHLPVHLQQCFAYCSIFPKGYAFQINKLVYIWIAQGLIQPANRMEDVGQEYFECLLSKSFFELPSYAKSYWRSKYYLMHELLHELATSVSSDDTLAYGGQDLGETQKHIYHLSVSRGAHLNLGFEWKILRTLVINTKYDAELELLELLKRVRVLDLSHSYMTQVPDSIGCLIHLRYLNLSGNHIHSLPESLCKLYHLQSLMLPQKCHRLPNGVTQLVSLRHLNASDTAISWISGIGRLTCLQELKVFHVKVVKGHDIGQLHGMKELRGQLCIQSLDYVKTKEEPLRANLKDKIHIRELQLKWMRWCRNRRPDAHVDVLECLQPPTGLEKLEIHWYRGLRSPSWLEEHSLQNLKSIYLIGCEKWKHLPPFGQLPFLEVVKLEVMDAIIAVNGTCGVFPSLKELWLKDTLVSFEGLSVVPEERQKLFPRLCKLNVQDCTKVKGLPPLSELQTLDELNLRKCPDLDAEMPDCLINLTSLAVLKISELQLTSFPGELLQWLKYLEIDSCGNLASWLANEIEAENFSSLTSLSITDTLLPTGPILKHLTFLHELRLNRCSKLISFTTEQQKWFKGLTMLRVLSITDCQSLKSLALDLQHLTSLERLSVIGCPGIRSLPRSLPVSLRRLELSNCNPGIAVLWQGESAPDWVKRVPYRYIE